MADPITWGLINLIKKGVKGVQTTLDGMKEDIGGLSTSFNEDFAEVKQAVSEVKTDTYDIIVRLDGIKDQIDEVYTFVNETNVVVKDILNGSKIQEWIADLAASGKQSGTYKDASRMNTLLASSDACKNATINQWLFDFAYDNSKVGQFFGSVFNQNWSSVTTFTQALQNSTIMSSVMNNSEGVKVIHGYSNAINDIFNNYNYIKNYQATSAMQNYFSDKVSRVQLSSYAGNNTPITQRCFMLKTEMKHDWYAHGMTYKYTLPNNEVKQITEQYDHYGASGTTTKSVISYCKKVEAVEINGVSGATTAAYVYKF